MDQTRPIFVYFLLFSHDKYSTNFTINDKGVDGVLGTRTRGGVDESTELWRHPKRSLALVYEEPIS